jgi:hypothetical protein
MLSGSQMHRIRRLQVDAGPQCSRTLHHLRVQGVHRAVREEAAECEQADLIKHCAGGHQALHAHRIADHPVGICMTLELLEGAASQIFRPINV